MKTKMQLGVVLATMLLLSMAFMPVVSAKVNASGLNEIPKQVLDLNPAPGNYINLKEAQLTIWNDNHTTLTINTKKEVNSGPQYFSIEVFPQNKTYKTTKKEIKDNTHLKQIAERQVNNSPDLNSKKVKHNGT